MTESSLYERLGGVYAIAAVVNHFSDALIEKHTSEKNPHIKDWNKEKIWRLSGLKFLRTLWLCSVAGGPFQYTARPLGDAHASLHIKPEEFDDVAAELARSLDHFNVPKREKEEVLGAFAANKPGVTAGSILR